MVEGYESPVAGVTGSADKEEEGDDEDEDITDDKEPSSKKKSKSATSSTQSASAPSGSKSMSILSRTMAEYDTCAPEKAEEFDPIQGKE